MVITQGMEYAENVLMVAINVMQQAVSLAHNSSFYYVMTLIVMTYVQVDFTVIHRLINAKYVLMVVKLVADPW